MPRSKTKNKPTRQLTDDELEHWKKNYQIIFPEHPYHIRNLLAHCGEEGWRWLNDKHEEPKLIQSTDADIKSGLKEYFSVRNIESVRKELSKMHCGQKTIDAILKSSKVVSVNKIKENPYSVASVKGVEFKDIDRMAFATRHFTADDPMRLAGAVDYVFSSEQQFGNTFMATDMLVDAETKLLRPRKPTLREKLSGLLLHSDVFPEIPGEVKKTTNNQTIRQITDDIFKKAMLAASEFNVNNGHKIFSYHEKYGFVFAPLHWKEIQLAQSLVRLRNESARKAMPNVSLINANAYLDASFPEFDSIQQQAVLTMFEEPITIMTGGPGTGKTEVIAAGVGAFVAQGFERIAIMATTGRASQNVREVLARRGILIDKLVPHTVHSSLGIKPGNEHCYFSHKKFAFPYDVIFCDEFSMADTFLAGTLLWALANGCRVVIVGDPRQLPSVGPGNILRDLTRGLRKLKDKNGNPLLFEADCPAWIHLENCYRHDKEIANLASSLWLKKEEREEAFHKAIYEGMLSGKIVKLTYPSEREVLMSVAQLARNKDKDESILFIAPRYEDKLGVHALNEVVRKVINPDGEMVDNYRVGDLVLQKTPDNNNGIFNGELGIVTQISASKGKNSPSSVTVEFPPLDADSEVRIVTHMGESIDVHWLLGYVSTVHKNQGSQADIAVCVIGKEGWDRQRLYTAMTRAKKRLVLLEIGGCLERAMKNPFFERRTRLPQRYASAVKKERESVGDRK